MTEGRTRERISQDQLVLSFPQMRSDREPATGSGGLPPSTQTDMVLLRKLHYAAHIYFQVVFLR